MISWDGKRVLVTGGAGFVGSHVVNELARLGAEVTVLDNLSTGRQSQIPDGVRFIFGDIHDDHALDVAMCGTEFVFHFAANADVRDGLKQPLRDHVQNTAGTHLVLEAMRIHHVKRLAFASSGAVYGDAAVIPTPECCPFPVQTSLYGASKVAAEGLVTAYAVGFGIQPWIFRFVSLLGPRYSHGHVVDFWRQLRGDPTRLRVLGNGKQRKSYLHVEDCVRGIFTALACSAERVNVFNLGHTEECEVRMSAALIADAMRADPKITYGEGDRGWVGDSPRILLDATRLRSLGWLPSKSIRESILDTVRYLESQP